MLDLDMSPYGMFVWASWAISALVLAGLVFGAILASRRWRRALEQVEQERADTSSDTPEHRP